MNRYRGSGATPSHRLEEENGFAFDADNGLSQITERTRLIIINHLQTCVTPKADRQTGGWFGKHPQVAILSDEIYSQMLYDGREHISLLNYPEIRDRWIVLMGGQKPMRWRMGFGGLSNP